MGWGNKNVPMERGFNLAELTKEHARRFLLAKQGLELVALLKALDQRLDGLGLVAGGLIVAMQDKGFF